MPEPLLPPRPVALACSVNESLSFHRTKPSQLGPRAGPQRLKLRSLRALATVEGGNDLRHVVRLEHRRIPQGGVGETFGNRVVAGVWT
jgi:hypothetical protein